MTRSATDAVRRTAAALDDDRWDRLRSRRARRGLVVAYAAAAVGAVAALATGLDLVGLLLVVAAVGVMVLLRRATRGIADLPDEVLDERGRQVRDATYRTAYVILVGSLSVVLLAAYIAVDGPRIAYQPMADHLHAVFWGVMLAGAGLPAGLVAWQQPEI